MQEHFVRPCIGAMRYYPRDMKLPILLTTTLLLTHLAHLSAAELKLAALFSDHMVLQREKPVSVWGWADADEKLTVEFGGQKKAAAADANGKWQVRLDPLPASAEPRTLLVQSAKLERKIEVTDVLVGEVWLGSGQSNMAMRVSGAQDFATEKAAADFPAIRTFNEVSKNSTTLQADGSGKWEVCSPETVGAFSATLYFFGREVHRELNVPVGLINSSVGGTPIEAWIAADVQNPEHGVAAPQTPDAVEAVPNPVPKRPAAAAKATTGGLFNGKIAPLIPYTLRGVLWYQGEANSHPGKSHAYQKLLPMLVNDWRKRWNEELPFAWVQLPNFNREGEGWSVVREAMLKTLRLPNTGMAITVDIGEATNIHPKNKQEVGRRLSLWALGSVYGKKVPAISGPLPTGHEVKGAEISVAFNHTDGGLVAKDGELAGFVVAGSDKEWKPARAKISGSKVIVSSAEVANPVAVRYAWAPNPVCNLFNGAGLPASPFRTDDWPADESAPKHPASAK